MAEAFTKGPGVAAPPSPGGPGLHEEYLPPRDPAMRHIEETAIRVAESDETVLITGETGVGKDVLARRIHNASPRAAGHFVHINCAAVSEGLIESELFGHVRGAYTGAVDSQPGQFEMASGGTLFLDEIGELHPKHQAKLLHVLQNRKLTRVGGRETITVDVRVIAATNQDLARAMKQGRFRPDLYYRLGVVRLEIPPLRERPGDIESLAIFFARRYATMFSRPQMAVPDEGVIDALRSHRFEGNVREMENLIKRGILLGSWEAVLSECASRDEESAGTDPIPFPRQDPPFFAAPIEKVSLKEIARRATEQAERSAIARALNATGWNRRKAAQLLEISYRSLLYKIRDYALTPVRRDRREMAARAGGVMSPREGTA